MRGFVVTILTAALAGCSSAPPKADAPAATGLISETTKSPEALEHFHKGQALFYNVRLADATTEFDEALRLDAGFVLAHAFRSQTVPGEQAARELEDAAKAAESLPKAERLFVQSMAAGVRGDVAEAEKLLRQLTTAAPQDWRSHFALGFELFTAQKYPEAAATLEEATRLHADAAFAQNMLGYALLRQDQTAKAIAAFEEYVRLLPQEPNPLDSLGEALVAAGRFEEADAAFNKALTLSPEFWNAHEGLAYSRIYAGDWAAGRKAFETARTGAPSPANKVAVSTELAAAVAAQGRTAEALQILDAAQQTPEVDAGTLASVPVRRAHVLIVAGQPRQAIAAVAPALTAADAPSTPTAIARPLRAQALRARLTAEGQLGDNSAAAATATLLQQDASSHPDDPVAQTNAAYANGIVAMTKRDFGGARMSFGKCAAEDDWCQWQAIVAAERAGDKAAADTGRERLLRVYRRDPMYLLARSQVMRAPGRTTE